MGSWLRGLVGAAQHLRLRRPSTQHVTGGVSVQQVPDAMYPPRTGKVVRFAGDSPVEVHTPSAAAAGSEASEAQPQHGVYLHSGASLDGSNLSAAGEEEEEELEEDWGEEGEETWYYGAETYTRGWRHVENQIVTWVALLVIAAIALNLRLSFEYQDRSSAGTRGVPVPPPPSMPPPPFPPTPPQPPPFVPPRSPPNSSLPPPTAVLRPPPTAVLRPPAPLPPPTPFPPPRTGWSDWLGRETPQSTIGICPCSAHINSWKVWVEQGLQATPQDTSPISGMTGTCSGPGGLTASVEVFPGTGAADTTLAVPGNWSAVYGQSGTYLDSWLGVGGSGPTPFAWSCLPGELVTGLHVAWEASAVAGTNIATGLRVYCENPNTCGGGTVPVPAQGGVPPPAAEQQPPPAAQQQQPPPAAAVVRPPPPAPVDASNWSPWLGAGTGPGDYAGLCPCGTYVQSWNLWSDPAYAGPDGSTGALSGLVAQCSGVDAQSLQVFPGSTGAATNALLNIEGFTGMTGQYGAFIASLNDVGGTAPQRFNYQCPGGNKVTGIDVDTQVQNGTEYIAGLRFYCGNAPQCPALPPSPPPTPLQAAGGAPPPVALARPPPLPSPRLPPPAPETPPDFSTTEGPSPEASPAPTPSPGPSGLPAGTWTDWVGSTAGPGDYGGVCSCGTHIASWNTWDDPAFVGPEGENGAIIGITATCSGPDQLVVEPLMGPGAPTDSISNPAGYTAVTGQYGKYFTTFLGMGTPGPRNFTAGCPGGLLVSGFAMDTDTVGGRELVTGMQFLCGDTVDCGGTIVVPEPPAPPALGTPPPAPPTQPLPLPPGSWSTYFGGTANPAAAPNTRIVEAACPCGQYINAFYIWVDEQYQQGAENGRLRGITADCNAGSSIKVFPGDGAPSQSNLQPDGFSGMDGEYGTYLNDINRLGPSSGPQTFQFYCPVGEKLLGYSDAGFRFAFDPVRCKFKPTQQTLQVCEESGLDLAQDIRKKQKRNERVAAEKLSVAEVGSGKALALGRVVGSLCVLTGRDGDAEGAMLASWVSQASFNPPGLTVAVKQDRAMESMLPVGASFNLNILAEGKERAVMKQMLKPFKPAEDRFAGMDVQRSEATGAVIIPDSAAYVECTVVSRMEAGDHVVLYAQVNDGKVLNQTGQSAVHYRRIGTNY